jgi:DNA-binding transcriptional LysR family regulator
MERRQLEYFLAVVDHGGFTNAARVLRVAQPSLSHAIASLDPPNTAARTATPDPEERP